MASDRSAASDHVVGEAPCGCKSYADGTAYRFSSRIVPATVPPEQRREAVSRACGIVSAKVAIDFVRSIRGR